MKWQKLPDRQYPPMREDLSTITDGEYKGWHMCKSITDHSIWIGSPAPNRRYFSVTLSDIFGDLVSQLEGEKDDAE